MKNLFFFLILFIINICIDMSYIFFVFVNMCSLCALCGKISRIGRIWKNIPFNIVALQYTLRYCLYIRFYRYFSQLIPHAIIRGMRIILLWHTFGTNLPLHLTLITTLYLRLTVRFARFDPQKSNFPKQRLNRAKRKKKGKSGQITVRII